jgi:TPR repeat protein
MGRMAVDFAKAIALFTRSAEAGHAVAQHNFGVRYLDGVFGVARDVAKAREWLARAAGGGFEKAAAELDAGAA